MFRFVFRALREEEGREGIIRAKNAFADLPPEAALAFARFTLPYGRRQFTVYFFSARRSPSIRVAKFTIFYKKLQKFADLLRARSRLYQNEFLQENMRLTAFFKIYKMCTLLHCSKLSILAEI